MICPRNSCAEDFWQLRQCNIAECLSGLPLQGETSQSAKTNCSLKLCVVSVLVERFTLFFSAEHLVPRRATSSASLL